MNTLLAADNGTQFKVSTPTTPADEPTTIVRIEGETSRGLVGTVIGLLEPCPTRELKLQLCVSGSELILNPITGTDLDNSWSFLGPDSLPYKWQIFIHYPVLILNDDSNTLLARYRRAKLGIVSRPRKAFIEVTPAGLSVADLIVVTFVSFMKQRVPLIELSSDSS
ncbi:hypothetical protein H0H87_003658 [Tephrocybe sp. NHM501043]|nr:hypothetical protein H0H87_003658 [Tephrocybe sp. NHM501043]